MPQGCDECEMLQGMVENAVSWMKAGLPLRLLKIVIYAKVLTPTHASMMLQRADGSELLALFSRLKDKLENKTPIPKVSKVSKLLCLKDKLENKTLSLRSVKVSKGQ